jgi:malonyl-CoA O-methyltransferase
VKIAERYGLPIQAVVRRRFDAAAATFDDAAVLHAEARSRMLERLALFKLDPERVLDVGAATGAGSAALAALYPQAQIIAVDESLPMARRAATNAPGCIVCAGDAHELPIADHSVDLVFANLLLPWIEPHLVLAEFARVLRKDGLALFTSFGPDTLVELRRAWSTVDDHIHVHGFIDMHDLGDLAARAGLSEPVMDVDRLELRYSSLERLIADLRETGAVNSASGRPAGLTGRGRWQAFQKALQPRVGADQLAVTVELVFGQAWSTGGKATPRPADGVARIAAEDLARTMKKGRSGDT